ncbi:nuclear transport factor 2 family protein [Nocardioides sp. LHD-245]|uniref:ester cyclase n=1 Tax=Nocardioides sp. LHD-245 TaxID=3051387 RepID=UPI0027DF2799|nr:nuclear transport factor 2 family protein [Nocardioides sp. LHD-245]
MSSYDPVAVAESIATRLWTEHDREAIEEVFTDDVVYRDVAWGYTFTGRDGVRDYVDKVLGGIPDFTETIEDVLDIRPGTVVARWRYSGTFSSPRITQAFDLPGTSVITVREDGLVSSNVDYYSANAFLAALDWAYPTVESLATRER